MDIGKLIRKRRIELKLTLEEIGNIVGVSKSTVKKWECGDISNMKRDKIALLAKALLLNPVSLITGEEIIEIESSNHSHKVTELSKHEIKVITAYREKIEMQPAVDKLLGIENDCELIPTLSAARDEGTENTIKERMVPYLSKFPIDDSGEL